SFFEGGIHVPFFMQWPARIPAGTKLTGRAAPVDIFATAAAAAGAKLPDDRVYDGLDLMRQDEGEDMSERNLYFRSVHYRTLVKGDWKLLASERPARAWLVNLTDDPTAHRNLASAEPEKRAELMAVFE